MCKRHWDSVFEFKILFPPTTQLSQSILGMCLSEISQIQLLYVERLSVEEDMIRFFIVALNKTFLCRTRNCQKSTKFLILFEDSDN